MKHYILLSIWVILLIPMFFTLSWFWAIGKLLGQTDIKYIDFMKSIFHGEFL
jgi:hypothetical protein